MLEVDLDKKPTVKLRLLSERTSRSFKVFKYEKDRVFLILDETEPSSSLYNFKEGLETEMIIYSPTRVIKLNSIVIESFAGSREICMELHDEYDIIQRRRYVRTKASYSIELKSEKFLFKAKTINIGGGGICFVGNNAFEIGQKFEFRLFLPEHEAIIGNGIVINKVEAKEDILIMFNFIDIDKETRNKIIRFCFEKEFNA